MSERKHRRSKLPVFVTAGFVTAALVGWLILSPSGEDAGPLPERKGQQADSVAPPGSGIAESDIRQFCSTCHVFAEPSLMPKVVWPAVGDRMYRFVGMQEPCPTAVMSKPGLSDRRPRNFRDRRASLRGRRLMSVFRATILAPSHPCMVSRKPLSSATLGRCPMSWSPICGPEI